MTTEPDDPPFTATVDAGLRDDGVWVITATLRYRDGVPLPGSSILGEARLTLLAGIAEAGKRGRKLGADRCWLRLDTGDRVREFAIGDVFDLDSLN